MEKRGKGGRKRREREKKRGEREKEEKEKGKEGKNPIMSDDPFHEEGKTDLLRKNTKKIYKAEIEKQTCRGAAGNELETHLSRWGDWD